MEAVEESLPELRRFQIWAHLPQTLEPAFQFQRLVDAQKAYLEGRDFIFHLWEEDRVVGGFGLHPRTLNPKALEVGYWIRTSEAGRGLATAATQRLVRFNFEDLGNVRLQVCANSTNLGSLRVIAKVGFKREGELKYFESQGNEEQRRNGLISGPITVVSALTVDDLGTLPWY